MYHDTLLEKCGKSVNLLQIWQHAAGSVLIAWGSASECRMHIIWRMVIADQNSIRQTCYEISFEKSISSGAEYSTSKWFERLLTDSYFAFNLHILCNSCIWTSIQPLRRVNQYKQRSSMLVSPSLQGSLARTCVNVSQAATTLPASGASCTATTETTHEQRCGDFEGACALAMGICLWYVGLGDNLGCCRIFL